jgi:EmrB/QacA subfamily drug resistance transporter
MTTTTTQARPAETDGRLDRRLTTLGLVVVLGAILSVLDATVVNVATRTLAEDLGASISTIQWVLTGYLLGFAGVIPLTGWAGERFGAKRVWIAALLVFLAGSVLAGTAWSVHALIAFRVVQGIGGGMILPVAQTILAQAAGPRRTGRIMSFIGVPMLMGSVAGPVIGGLIVSSVSWRWIFFLNLPIGLVAVVCAARLMPSTPARPGSSLDRRGLVLLSSGVIAVVYGMSEAGGSGGFGSVSALLPIGAGMLLIAAYAVHAHFHGPGSLIDVSMFRHRGFAAAAATNLIVSVALFGVLVLLPLYWQVARGHSALVTGLLLAPQALGAAAAMPLAGRITDRTGPGVVVPVGVALGLLGTAVYTQAGADTSYVRLAAALFVIGLGLGATIVPLMAAAFHGLPREQIAKASSAFNTIQRVGASIGTTVLAVTLQHAIAGQHLGGDPLRGHGGGEVAAAFASSYWVAFALSAVALIPALLLPRTRK